MRAEAGAAAANQPAKTINAGSQRRRDMAETLRQKC
jgi:hypothetical protein